MLLGLIRVEDIQVRGRVKWLKNELKSKATPMSVPESL